MIDTNKEIKSVSYNGVDIPFKVDNTALIGLIQRSITTLEIPNGTTSIGSNTFRGCSGLTEVTIPNSVKSIGNDAFNYCSSLTSITFEENSKLTSIGSSAFGDCSSLTSITIPSSITSIEQYTFYGCDSLTEMTILATTPPTLSSTNAISSATTSIYIPAGTLSAYKTATNWSSFASKFVELSA